MPHPKNGSIVRDKDCTMPAFDQPALDTSPEVSDEIRKTTCYMCACRCGINVHLKSGKVSYIEGNLSYTTLFRSRKSVV